MARFVSTAVPGRGKIQAAVCESCSVGRSSMEMNATACTRRRGKYSDVEGADVCKSCAPGFTRQKPYVIEYYHMHCVSAR